MSKNLTDAGKIGTLVPPQELSGGATSTTGTKVDMETCRQGVLMLVCNTGAAVDITTMSLEHSEDGTNYVAAPVVDIDTGLPTSISDIGSGENDVPQLYQVPNMRRYVRLKWTDDASSSDDIFYACIIGQDPMFQADAESAKPA